ncbi:hypothetical protein [Fulvimarina sp. MAC3]
MHEFTFSFAALVSAEEFVCGYGGLRLDVHRPAVYQQWASLEIAGRIA